MPLLRRSTCRERRIGRHPEKGIGIDVRLSKTSGEGSAQRGVPEPEAPVMWIRDIAQRSESWTGQ